MGAVGRWRVDGGAFDGLLLLCANVAPFHTVPPEQKNDGRRDHADGNDCEGVVSEPGEKADADEPPHEQRRADAAAHHDR